MKKIVASGLILGTGLVLGFAPAARAQTTPAAPAVTIPNVSLDLRDAPIRQALEQLFKNGGAQYVLDPNIQGFVTLNVRDQPFESALRLLLRSANPPLTYTRENGVYLVRPRSIASTTGAPGFPGAEGETAPPTLEGGEGGVAAAAGATKFDKITVTYADAADLAAVFGGTVISIGAGRGNQGGGGFGGGGGLGGGGLGGGGGCQATKGAYMSSYQGCRRVVRKAPGAF
jgi:hypothetical protein